MGALTLQIIVVVSLCCGIVGLIIGFCTRRARPNGIIAVALLFLAALFFVFIEPSGPTRARFPLMFAFMLLAPSSSMYSFFTFKRLSPKWLGVAALTAGIVMTILFLFVFVGHLVITLQLWAAA